MFGLWVGKQVSRTCFYDARGVKVWRRRARESGPLSESHPDFGGECASSVAWVREKLPGCGVNV